MLSGDNEEGSISRLLAAVHQEPAVCLHVRQCQIALVAHGLVVIVVTLDACVNGRALQVKGSLAMHTRGGSVRMGQAKGARVCVMHQKNENKTRSTPGYRKCGVHLVLEIVLQ